MHGDLSGRQCEDQPAASDIDVPILQDVAEELAIRLRVLAVDDGVGADDLHCARIEDPEAFGPPGLLKNRERNTGFADNRPEYLRNSASKTSRPQRGQPPPSDLHCLSSALPELLRRLTY